MKNENNENAVVFIDQNPPSLSRSQRGRVIALPIQGETIQEGSPKVFYIKLDTNYQCAMIPLNRENSTDICEKIKKRLPKSFSKVYICWHIGGGGLTEAYKNTRKLNLQLNERERKRWFFLAISRTHIYPNWLYFKDEQSKEIKYQTINRDEDLVNAIHISIEESLNKINDLINNIVNIDGVIRTIDNIYGMTNTNESDRNSNLDLQNHSKCAVVVGCAYIEDENADGKAKIKQLFEILCQKCMQTTVFICTNEGIIHSSWDKWNTRLLSNDCISHFHQENPKTKIFALNTIPYNEDDTLIKEFFTDWMFAVWIDCFGEENVRLYKKDEKSVQGMITDLQTGNFTSKYGESRASDECHLDVWFNYLMLRMKH